MQVRREFWNDIKILSDKWPVDIAFVDANGSVGSIVTEWAGDSGDPEAEDANSSLFHTWLAESHMKAANTFLSHPGDSTFFSDKGAKVGLTTERRHVSMCLRCEG